jgi:HEXXH motif-containing protein
LIKQLTQTIDHPPPQLELAGKPEDRPWIAYALDVFDADWRRDGKEPDPLIETPAAEADLDALTEALSLLRRSWPEMAELIDLLARQIVWFRTQNGGPGPASAVLIQAFGAVFLAAGNDALSYLSSVVHEVSHLDVIMRLSADRYIENRDHVGKSPFRQKARPLIRVLHAALVTTRMSMAYTRCAKYGKGAVREQCDDRARHLDAMLTDSLRGLQEAEWTQVGAQLARSLNAYAQRRGLPV